MTTKRTTKNAPADAGADARSKGKSILDIDISPWDVIVGGWRQGKPVDRAAIVKLLDEGVPVPVEANALLSGLLTGEVKARRGNKPGPLSSRTMRQTIADHVASIETMLKYPATIPPEFDKEGRDQINALRLRSNGTPNAKARELVAEMYGVSTGTVGQCITERNNSLRSIASEHGTTLLAVKRALRIGEP